MDLLDLIAEALIGGEDALVRERTGRALAESRPAGEVLERGLIAGMTVISERFRAHEIFLPDVLLSARAMQAGMDVLKPLLARDGVPLLGKIVIGTVRGDLHDIGKNLVSILLKGAGFEVFDLGKDVPAERFVDTALAEGAPLIGMSALLTTTMTRMKDVVQLLRARGLGGRIKTIVGGAPLSPDFAREIGADAYASDAATAVGRVKALIAAAAPRT